MEEPDILDKLKNSNIDYLVKRKFRYNNKALAAILAGETPPAEDEYLREQAEYRAFLEKKTLNEIFELDSLERKKEAEEEQRRKEQALFFHKPKANADFDHWSKANYWTLEEAIALSFGKDPVQVNTDSLKLYTSSSFGKAYKNLRDLAIRAKNWQKLYDPVYPIIFVKWMKDNDNPFPEELEKLVIARNENLIDWKKKYEESQQEYVALQKDYKDYQGKFRELIDILEQTREMKDKQIAELEERIHALAAKQVEAPKEKPLHKKERDSLSKLLIGMAANNYGYNDVKNSTVKAREIVDDILTKTGISIDEDTVRKHFRYASKFLVEPDEQN